MSDTNIPCESDSYPSTETRACDRCSKAKPLSSFLPRRRPGSRSSTCRACYKTDKRRRLGIPPRPAGWGRKPAPELTKAKALKLIRTLLGKLLEQKATAQGVAASTVEYQVRYRCDPAFREREIARTWARKAASGVGRTDGRTSVPMHADGTLTPSVVQELFAAADACAYCHEPMHPREKTLDHVTPVSRGGKHSITNVVIACRSCNSRKQARTPDEWLSADGIGDSAPLRHAS